MDKEEYLKNPNKCPYCSSSEIEGEVNSSDGDKIYVDAECIDCGAVWEDIYTLTDVIFYDD